jgi:hypothetical protein
VSPFVPINAPHLVYIVVWIENGDSRCTESPLLAADLGDEPPRLLPMLHTTVPDGAPHRKVLYDSTRKTWWDVDTGESLSEWKAVLAPLYALWDARQPAPLPSAPVQRRELEIPDRTPKPPHRLGDTPYRTT